MSVLETFVHDPLVEWTRRAPVTKVIRALVLQRKAKAALENIGARLEGVAVGVGYAPSLPLSTSGQVRRLIEEATSLFNLVCVHLVDVLFLKVIAVYFKMYYCCTVPW